MQYYYAINRASRRRPPRTVIVTPRTFRPCSLHAPRINTSHSTSQFTTSHFRTSQFTHARRSAFYLRPIPPILANLMCQSLSYAEKVKNQLLTVSSWHHVCDNAVNVHSRVDRSKHCRVVCRLHSVFAGRLFRHRWRLQNSAHQRRSHQPCTTVHPPMLGPHKNLPSASEIS